MKKTLLLITSLVFITSLSSPQTKVNKNNLVQYGDKWFKENDDTPFTGIVFDMSKETGNKILESKYVKGLRHGKYVEWYNDGKKKEEGKYRNGIKHGLWTEWFLSGQKWSEGTFNNGKPNGKWTGWWINGQKAEEGTYKDGIEDGKWTFWHENGQKRTEENYKNGQRAGEPNWWAKGQKKVEKTFKGNFNKDADILFGKTLVLLDTGDIENAQFQFEVLIDKYGSTRSGKISQYYLGSIYFDKSDYDNAKPHLEQFINSTSENILLSSGHFMLSNIYKRESNQDKEEEHLELAVKSSSIPHNRHSMELALAELYVDRGKEGMAMDIVQKILNLEKISSGNKKKAEELSGLLTRKSRPQN